LHVALSTVLGSVSAEGRAFRNHRSLAAPLAVVAQDIVPAGAAAEPGRDTPETLLLKTAS
jgi:hypothetical protein